MEEESSSEGSSSRANLKNADALELGGNITLKGFSELDGASMIVLKKIVGSYVKKITETTPGFENITLTMKSVHKKEDSEKFEVHGKLIAKGKIHNAEITDRNLFFSVDRVLKKLEAEIS